VNYTYRGDRLTDPRLKGARCVAVRNPITGKCITQRSAMLVLFEGEIVPRVVLRRQLRKDHPIDSPAGLLN
jgi:hypothetical protein